MSKLSKKEIEHLAALARLEFSEKEKAKFQKELSSILNYVSQLQKVKTKKIEPISQITGLVNRLREDEVRFFFKEDQQGKEALLKNAPSKQDNYLKVKAVFEE